MVAFFCVLHHKKQCLHRNQLVRTLRMQWNLFAQCVWSSQRSAVLFHTQCGQMHGQKHLVGKRRAKEQHHRRCPRKHCQTSPSHSEQNPKGCFSEKTHVSCKANGVSETSIVTTLSTNIVCGSSSWSSSLSIDCESSASAVVLEFSTAAPCSKGRSAAIILQKIKISKVLVR